MNREKIINDLGSYRDELKRQISALDYCINVLQSMPNSFDVTGLFKFLNEKELENSIKNVEFKHFPSRLNFEPPKGISGYDFSWTYKEKIKFILSHEQRLLRLQDFIKILIENEPNEKKNWQEIISPVLSKMANSNEGIFKYNSSSNKKEVYWGLYEWKQENIETFLK
jgi:hypothetical protein